jgi:rubredoxin
MPEPYTDEMLDGGDVPDLESDEDYHSSEETKDHAPAIPAPASSPPERPLSLSKLQIVLAVVVLLLALAFAQYLFDPLCMFRCGPLSSWGPLFEPEYVHYPNHPITMCPHPADFRMELPDDWCTTIYRATVSGCRYRYVPNTPATICPTPVDFNMKLPHDWCTTIYPKTSSSTGQ